MFLSSGLYQADENTKYTLYLPLKLLTIQILTLCCLTQNLLGAGEGRMWRREDSASTCPCWYILLYTLRYLLHLETIKGLSVVVISDCSVNQ